MHFSPAALITRQQKAALWFNESTREERVDGVFGLIESNAELLEVIEHLPTFPSGDGQPQLFSLGGHEFYVASNDQEDIVKTSLQACEGMRC